MLVISTLKELYGLPDELFIEENFNEPLSGKLFRLSKIDLVYLFFEFEKRLGLRIEESELHDYGFSTINDITKALEGMTK